MKKIKGGRGSFHCFEFILFPKIINHLYIIQNHNANILQIILICIHLSYFFLLHFRNDMPGHRIFSV